MHYFFVNRIEIKSETRKIEEKKKQLMVLHIHI